jgi:DNA invertase Pin-like site-specific DNA recombinase
VKDIRQMAEERARQRAGEAPSSAGFMTERARAKEALRAEVSTYTGENVRKIAAASDIVQEDRILRVAAYCRVSTDDIDQLLSIELQKNNYQQMIRANPKWRYVGTYVDDGFSGTNTAHRQGFQKLMKDAMDGKIDMIITKAVSRFARNLMDCIGWVEALQNHDPPIRVFFEQENLDTMSQTSGIILFVLAMVAQEESHMKSEAILLSLEWRFSRGRFMTPRLFGYDKVEVPDGYGGHKKVLQVNENEARVVRWMYSTLVNGGTPEEIADVLTELAIPTGGRRRDGTLNTHWTPKGVIGTMRNEKHCGDVLARKTYTPNYKDHKAKKNNGKKNKYFQPDHHDAIVSRATWNAAQRILNSRKFGHEGSYLPMRVVDRGALSGYISMNRSWAGFDYEDYYRASQIAMGILDEELDADLEKEYLPEGGHRIGGLVDDHGIAQIARDLTAAEQEIKDELEGKAADEDSARDTEAETAAFQVVNGNMFSRLLEPVICITPNGITFNKCCVTRLDSAENVEILFNPVERMLVVRPCADDHPNAVSWEPNYKRAAPFSRALYSSMGWEKDYTFRVSCQRIETREEGSEGCAALVFDLDNFTGRAISRRMEENTERQTSEPENSAHEEAKSYYYPPDEDEPREIREMEERFRQAVEQNKKLYGVPVFRHESGTRGFNRDIADLDIDIKTEARVLGAAPAIDMAAVNRLLDSVRHDPPPLQRKRDQYPEHITVDSN